MPAIPSQQRVVTEVYNSKFRAFPSLQNNQKFPPSAKINASETSETEVIIRDFYQTLKEVHNSAGPQSRPAPTIKNPIALAIQTLPIISPLSFESRIRLIDSGTSAVSPHNHNIDNAVILDTGSAQVKTFNIQPGASNSFNGFPDKSRTTIPSPRSVVKREIPSTLRIEKQSILEEENGFYTITDPQQKLDFIEKFTQLIVSSGELPPETHSVFAEELKAKINDGPIQFFAFDRQKKI